VAADQTVTTDEDAPTPLTLSATDADGSPVTYTILTQPAHGTLSGSGAARTYTPMAEYYGTDSFTYKANDGGVDSNVATVSITVTAINDMPVATGQVLATNEDTATALTLNASDLEGTSLAFTVVSAPAHGTLTGTGAARTYTPAPDYTDPDSFTFKASDGSGESNLATVSITVAAVNDAPRFTKGADQQAAEDSGARSVTGWASAISAGPGDEAYQALGFLVTNDSSGLFSVQPAIAPNGTLTYTPAPDANGLATVTVRLRDTSGTANGGADTSASQTFTIAVAAVNDAPSFSGGADQTAVQDTGAKTIAGWATAINAGAPNESGQSLNFIVSNDNPAMFLVQPAIDSNGTLTFTPTPGVSSVAYVTVRLHDNGGTAQGGVDTSAPQTFTVTVSIPVKPSLSIADASIPEGNSGTKALVFNVTLSAASAVPVTVNYITLGGSASSKDYQSASGTLTFAPGETSKGISIMVTGDTTRENNETLAVRVSAAVGAIITRSEAMGVILDDDTVTAYTSQINSFYGDSGSGKLRSVKETSSGKDTSSGKGSSSGKGTSSGKDSPKLKQSHKDISLASELSPDRYTPLA
jgi:large repetitive protein